MLNKKNMMPILSTIVFCFVMFFNYKSSSGISGLSDKNMTLITPIDFTFSIWGIIYILGLVVLLLFWRNFFQKKETDPQIFLIYNLVLLLNTLWIFVWLREFIFLSWIVIFAILMLLVYINHYIMTNPYQDSKIISIFFEIHLAWILVAFFLNALVVWNNYHGISDDYGSYGLAIAALIMIVLFANFLLFKANK
ncbi:MAG: hypothetical protein ACRCV0_03215, partial [Brevinema sp.]